MASAFQCISNKPVSKQLKAAVAASEADFRRTFPDKDDAEIAELVAEFLEKKVNDRQRAVLHSVANQVRIEAEMAVKPVRGGEWSSKKMEQRLLAVYLGSDTRIHADVRSVMGQWEANRALLHSGIADVFQRFAKRMFTGTSRDRATQALVSEALWPDRKINSPVAREMAKAIKANDLFYENHMNSKGVKFHVDPKRQGIVVHEARKLRRVPMQVWKEDIINRLDLARMKDKNTGAPLTRDKMMAADGILDNIYRAITTHGTSEIKPGSPGHVSWWEHLDESRFFMWKDFEAWKGYNDQFGFDDFFVTLMHYTDQQARNMGIVDALGPDPVGTTKWITDLTKKAGATGRSPGDMGAADSITNAWKMVSGDLGKPGQAWVAEAMASARGWTHSAVLGSITPLAAVTDTITSSAARRFNGIADRMGFVKMVNNFARLAAAGPRSMVMREALDIGIGLQSIQSSVMGAMRGIGEFDGFRIAHVVSDFNFRVTGLTAITDANQAAFARDFVRSLTRNLGKKFADFDKTRLTQTLMTYGINEEDWLRISQNARFIKTRGVKLLSMAKMGREGFQEDATRLISMVEKEKDVRAVITSSPQTKARLRGGTRPGSFWGETIRSGTDLLSWATTFIWSQIAARLQDQYWRAGTRVGSLATLAIAMTLGGAMLAQFRQLSAGKELYDWNDKRFWLEAAAVGGGLGLLTDFIFKEHYGGTDSLLTDLAGPTIGTLSQIIGFVPRVGQGIITGEPFNAGREAVSIGQKIIPFTSWWFGKVAVDRIFFDSLSKWLDPNAEQAFHNRTLARARDHDQGFWWVPGETSPSF